MNNIYLFKDFINEGIFGSKWSDIVDKIYNYIQKMPIAELVKSTDLSSKCEFDMRKNHNIADDPYGEEDWEDNAKKVIIRIKFESAIQYPELHINDDELDATHREVRKLERLIKKRIEEKEKIEREQRLKNLDI